MDRPFAEPLTFPLGGGGAIRLDEDGFQHPSGARGGGSTRSAYADVTHLSASSRALWVATRRSVYVIGRNQFEDPDGPENLVRALLERIAARPEGGGQLARMAEIEETSRHPGALHATRGLAIACGVVYLLQLWFGQALVLVGSFTADHVLAGEWWRVVTAHLLHGFLLHLVLNLLGLLALGPLVERPLGTARTVCVMAASAVGAMLASGLVGETSVVGVSGIVFGLLGALLWLEFRFTADLPAWWRVPRRALYWMLGISAALTLVPFIAGAAHVGGLLAGGAAAAALSWHSLGHRRPSPAWVRAWAGASLAIALVGVGTAASVLASAGFGVSPGRYVALYAEKLYALPEASPEDLNNVAWILAIDPEADSERLALALRLAERAVEESHRQEPHILDTLAEVYFQLDEPEAALAAIDEAIALRPDSDYYHEQKRRFLGERDPDDRPSSDPSPSEPEPVEPGLRV